MDSKDPTASKMAIIQASMESGYRPSHLDDPFDWTVDEVIYCLCSPDSPMLRSAGEVSLPDPDAFAKTLQEERINGQALLTVVTLDVLRNDLGVKQLGIRGMIHNLIQQLQHQSSKYQEILKRKAIGEGRLSSIVHRSCCSTPFLRSPEPCVIHYQNQSLDLNYDYDQAKDLFEQGPIPAQPSSRAADTHQIIDVSFESGPESIREAEPSLTTPPSQKQRETTFIDHKGQQRRRLELGPATVTKIPIQIDQTAPAGGDAPQEVNHSERLGLSEAVLQETDQLCPLRPASGGLLHHLDTDEHLDREAPSSRTMSNHNTDGDLYIGQQQRKRIKPTLVAEPGDDRLEKDIVAKSTVSPKLGQTTGFLEPASTLKLSSLGKKVKRAIEHMYFGPSAFTVDDVFYGDTALGDALQDDSQTMTVEQQEVSFNSGGQSSDAQRLWVNAKMKYFFRSSTSNLVIREGGREVGIIPYPDRLGKRNRPLSMTLLSRNAGGVSVLRANRSKWTANLPPAKTMDKTNSSNSFEVLDPALTVDDNNGDWDALEKWKYVETDEMLPLYGESGSEGEYDLETWREMEAENGKIVRPEGRSKSQKLSQEEVEAALDIAITQLCDEWRLKQRPKMQHKAWRYWAKARRDHTTEVQAKTLEQRHGELEARILSLRKEISEEDWSKVDQITRQSKSLQPSVFDREECQWKLSILHSKQAPQKLPAPLRKPRKVKTDTPPVQHGEENIDSETSSTGVDETDDDLDDFIVDDEIDDNDYQPMLEDGDMTMADVEDGMESDTLVIIPKDTLPAIKEERHSPERPFKTEKQSNSVPLSAANFIDLTQASDPSSSPPPKMTPARIVTPPIINSEEESEAWFQRSRGKKPVFKHPPSANAVSVVNLDTDSDCQVLVKPPTELPPFNDVKRIQGLSPTELVEKQDRKRLLVWLIAHTHDDKRERASVYVDSLNMEGCFVQVKAGLKKMKAEKKSFRGKDQATSENILQVAAWYVGWTIPVKPGPQGISISHIRTTLENDDGFELFYEFMLECLRHYNQTSPTKSNPTKKKKAETSSKCVDYDLSDSSALINPRKIASESQETIQKREVAHQRMREDKYRAQLRAQRMARRMELMPRFAAMTTMQTEQVEVILNPGKLEDQASILLNAAFGRGAQLKKHQKEGLQFMWREITGDHKELQGCLLAQTMGLGKTIQVIALLVAISDAANSSHRGIRDQVPVELRSSQTLVLCPPALIENWWDEFLMWPPKSNYLGEVRKISAVVKLHERVTEILAWVQEGGILLMGYPTFRDLIQNKPRVTKGNKGVATAGPAPLTDEQYRVIRSALLERTNLVIADEAHEFKSQTSCINQVINQIKCKSRIALTGSPLSNNLGEYYSMIDWIAPGYLGTYPDFKDVYEDPIQAGLYQDQKPARYRESRKRLKALELELKPKIHRADLTALHGSLSGKSEFVVRVPLTAFQEGLYRDFISIISTVNEDTDRKVRTTKLWSCLLVLQLLCNHPKSFLDRLKVEQNDSKSDQKPGSIPKNGDVEQLQGEQGNRKMKQKVGSIPTNGAVEKIQSEQVDSKSDTVAGRSLSGSDDDPGLDEPLPKTMLSQVLSGTEKAFSELGEDVDALHLSNKMQALIRIIELSETAGDKVLVFSHRLDTLDYVGKQLQNSMKNFDRIDGKTPPQKRQEITKSFNEGSIGVCLISTRAGGQGLNMFGANRVVILDNHFNPTWEQQAVGRAYRIGQKKHVFVYRLTVAGTFEEEIQAQALFKEQLATRVLEKKNPNRIGVSGAKQYLFLPREVEKGNIEKFLGKDTVVLDHLLADQVLTPIVSITPSETFYVDDGHDLTAQERKEAEQMLRDEQLRRRDPAQYQALMQQRNAQQPRSVNSGAFSLSQPDRPLPTHSAPASQNPWSSSRSPSSFAAPSASMTEDGLPALSVHSYVDDVDARLAYAITNLFGSDADLADRERAPKALRMEAKSNILDLVSKKGPVVSRPRYTAGQLRIMIDEQAKNEADYRRLWQGIRSLLEMEDVNPDALLQVMVDKLGQPGQSMLGSQNERSGSSFTEIVTSSHSEKTVQSATPKEHPAGSSKPVPKLKLKPGSTAKFQSAPTGPSQTRNKPLEPRKGANRSQLKSIESEPPAKKQKTSSMDTPNYSSMGSIEDQFERLLDSERKRK